MKSLTFYDPEKRYSFTVDTPCMGHYRGYKAVLPNNSFAHLPECGYSKLVSYT